MAFNSGRVALKENGRKFRKVSRITIQVLQSSNARRSLYFNSQITKDSKNRLDYLHRFINRDFINNQLYHFSNYNFSVSQFSIIRKENDFLNKNLADSVKHRCPLQLKTDRCHDGKRKKLTRRGDKNRKPTAPLPQCFSEKCCEFYLRDCLGLERLLLIDKIHRAV